jgi:poly(hydroxyalkanoate) depolymerase family esterase
MNKMQQLRSVPRTTPPVVALKPRRAGVTPGQFLDRAYTNAEGTMEYKLYVPKNYTGARAPLLVMLHGCKQNPDDFATGTRMNDLADQQGFLVVYPAQRARANGQKCWNWFDTKDQVREQGEPSLIAGLTLEVAAGYAVEEQHIFIAGMSSGAAMAVIMGATYPELFAAVGAHSGLPYGAAYDLSSAFAAMWGSTTLFGLPMLVTQRSPHWSTATRPVPTIVFHGDEDSTVRPHNGDEIINQAVQLAGLAHGDLEKSVKRIRRSNGREYTATSYRFAATQSVIEHRALHGAGHAWSGGSPDGSHTDPEGPDASAQMVEFFLAQPCVIKGKNRRAA